MTNRPDDAFGDVFAANDDYAQHFRLGDLEARAARGLAVLTCMDSRIEPLAMLGLLPGDAKILRNAGARVTDDVLRTLVVAAHLLDVNRVLIVPHTRCRMASGSADELHETIEASAGVDTRSLDLQPVTDVRQALRHDLQRVKSWPFLPADLAVSGALYDVDTGRLERVDG